MALELVHLGLLLLSHNLIGAVLLHRVGWEPNPADTLAIFGYDVERHQHVERIVDATPNVLGLIVVEGIPSALLHFLPVLSNQLVGYLNRRRRSIVILAVTSRVSRLHSAD